MLKFGHTPSDTRTPTAELQPLFESTAAMIEIPLRGDVLPSDSPSKRARPSTRTIPTRRMPASRIPSKHRKKTKVPMATSVVVPSSDAPRSKRDAGATGGLPPKSPELPFPALILEIRQLHRMRQDFQNFEQGAANRLHALRRRLKQVAGGDTTASKAVITKHVAWLKEISTEREKPEAAMRALARQLPVYQSFVKGTCGFAEIGLAMIVGEAGDLTNYSGPDKLKRRMGLAPYCGKAPSTWARCGGLKKREWTMIGYSRRRRSGMYVIAGALLKHKKKNRYGALYAQYQAHELAKAKLAGLKVRAGKKGDPTDDIAHGFITRKHIQFRVERRIAQQLLIDLWRAWNGQRSSGPHSAGAEPSPPPVMSEALVRANLGQVEVQEQVA